MRNLDDAKNFPNSTVTHLLRHLSQRRSYARRGLTYQVTEMDKLVQAIAFKVETNVLIWSRKPWIEGGFR